MEWLISSFCPAGFKLRFFSPIEPLMVKFKLSFYVSVLIGVPYLSKQVWGFIAPGLYANERSLARNFGVFSWFLFLSGAAFALYIILPLIIQFSLGFQSVYLEAAIGIAQFVSLTGWLILGFGVMFQFPILVFILVRSGLVSLERLKAQRAIVFVVILFVSALLTPPDFVSQLLMGIPTYLLFELGLILAAIFGTGRKENKVEPDGSVDEIAETVSLEKSPEINPNENNDMNSYNKDYKDE
jgi:sec-independent protein translocase protein TatC